jgi:hypothetical protein
MAERLVLICDVCMQPATETVAIRAGGKSMLKDLCVKHLGELLTGTRSPRRGRPRSTNPSPAKSRAVRSRQGSKVSSSRTKARKSRAAAKAASMQ